MSTLLNFEVPSFPNPFSRSKEAFDGESTAVELMSMRDHQVLPIAVSHLITSVPEINFSNPVGMQVQPKAEQVKQVEAAANQGYDAAAYAEQARAKFAAALQSETNTTVSTDFSGNDQ